MDEIKSITIIGELLRTQKINPYYADKTTQIFFELFKTQLYDATGITPDFVLASDISRFNRKLFYKLAGYNNVSTEYWVQIASGNFHPKAVEYFAECFRDTLIISHEAGSLIPILERANIPYIDFVVSPIRFLNDLLLAFRTNIASVNDKIQRYWQKEHEFIYAAKLLRAQFLSSSPRSSFTGFPENSLLICGQTDLDLSLIKDGRVMNFADCMSSLLPLIKEHDHIFYKPHPMEAQVCNNRSLISSIHGLKFVKGNIYHIMCDDNLRSVAAISSGVLHEAPFFDKKAFTLSHQYLKLASTKGPVKLNEYAIVKDEYFSPTFWQTILSPILPVRECLYFNFSDRSNLLRKTLGMWWGSTPEKVKIETSQPITAWCRNILSRIDPSGAYRQRLDPSGIIRKGFKSFFRNS